MMPIPALPYPADQSDPTTGELQIAAVLIQCPSRASIPPFVARSA
jgi:hypothetical protein